MQTSFCTPFFLRTVVICSSESRVAFYFQTSRSRRPQTGWCSKAHFHYNRSYCRQVYAADWRLALREYNSITSHFIITFFLKSKETQRNECIVHFFCRKLLFFDNLLQFFSCFLTQIKHYNKCILLVSICVCVKQHRKVLSLQH